METIENNKLIAEFMNEQIDNAKFGGAWEVVINTVTPYSLYPPYDKSYDWLIPVVEKIESLGYFTSICKMDSKEAFYMKIFPNSKTYNYQDEFFHFHFVSPIEQTESRILATWDAVVKFIKWHNEERTTANNPTES